MTNGHAKTATTYSAAEQALKKIDELTPLLDLAVIHDRASSDWKTKTYSHKPTDLHFLIADQKQSIKMVVEKEVFGVVGTQRIEALKGHSLKRAESRFKGGRGFWYKVDNVSAMEELLRSYFGESISEELTARDLTEIATSDVDDTTKKRLVDARLGQGRFRKDVIALWGGMRCIVSGVALSELLVASHIKPWRTSSNDERLDSCNGLLLATHLDKAFDKYLISFQAGGDICRISILPRARADLTRLGVNGEAFFSIEHMTPDDRGKVIGFLEGHYERHKATAAQH